jgi:hypothetical protein
MSTPAPGSDPGVAAMSLASKLIDWSAQNATLIRPPTNAPPPLACDEVE